MPSTSRSFHLRFSGFFLVAALVPWFAAPATAQRSLWLQRGTEALAQLGRTITPAGDVDADGVADFFVNQITAGANGIGRVHLLSGRTRTALRTFVSPAAGVVYGGDVGTIFDIDRDGVRDIAITRFAAQSILDVHSGATGTRLAAIAQHALGQRIGDAGDVNGDGVGDIAVILQLSGSNLEAWVLRGDNGQPLARLPAPPTGQFTAGTDFHLVGDLNGDARPELLIAPIYQGAAYVCELAPLRILRVLDVPGRSQRFGEQVSIADTDGDGVPDILLGDQSRAHLFSGRTSAVRSYQTQSSWGFAAITSDLNGDGFADLALDDNHFLRFVSGTTGAILASWRYGQAPSLNQPSTLAAIGDLDNDGIIDVAIGNPLQGPPDQAGGFEVISPAILAEVTILDGACGGQPLPQLSITRPILGQTMTVSCRDGAAGATGVLFLSRAPATSTYLGVSTCYAWLDLGTTSVLSVTSQTAWTLPVPLPNAAVLRGLEVGMQVLYGPTFGPLSFDLSNGVRGRLGS